MNTWRDIARPIIVEVIARIGTEDEKALRRALFEAYPFGEREYHPYKIWLDEIRVQKGLKTFGRQPGMRKGKPIEKDPNQMGLFE